MFVFRKLVVHVVDLASIINSPPQGNAHGDWKDDPVAFTLFVVSRRQTLQQKMLVPRML